MTPLKLAFVTSNAGKAKTAREHLAPLGIEDSGFCIDELSGYPGPMIKHVLTAIGAKGIAHLADLTTTRQCHIASCLVYTAAARGRLGCRTLRLPRRANRIRR